MRLKKFSTGIKDDDLIKSLLSAVEKSDKKRADNKEFKSYEDIAQEFGVSMELLNSTTKALSEAKSINFDKFLLSGNTKIIDGDVVRGYCRAGELMVHSIEEAFQELNFRVPVTGEYLIATPEEGWGGAH